MPKKTDNLLTDAQMQAKVQAILSLWVKVHGHAPDGKLTIHGDELTLHITYAPASLPPGSIYNFTGFSVHNPPITAKWVSLMRTCSDTPQDKTLFVKTSSDSTVLEYGLGDPNLINRVVHKELDQIKQKLEDESIKLTQAEAEFVSAKNAILREMLEQ